MEAPGLFHGRPRSFGRICIAEVKKWDGNDSHHQCAQGEPQRTASLRRIVVLIFPIFRSQRILNCGGLAESVALRLAMLSSSFSLKWAAKLSVARLFGNRGKSWSAGYPR